MNFLNGRSFISRIGLTLVVLIAMVGFIIGLQVSAGTEPIDDQELLSFHFIDVGQGDSILVRFPSGENMLIDAGESDRGPEIASYLKKLGIGKLDWVVATHPHADHIGGLAYILTHFDIGSIYMPRVIHTTATYEKLLTTIKSIGLKVKQAKTGVEIPISSDVKAVFMAPSGDTYDKLNDFSAVLRISYVDESFLLAGDAETESESEMVDSGAILESDVLKAGHHGSKTSSTLDFLRAVAPKYVVISVGADNRYGHPSNETIGRLEAAGAMIFTTANCGTIISETDGYTLKFITEKEISKHPIESENGIVISYIDLKDEVATITNLGKETVDISGWQLVSVSGNQRYIFPKGTFLPGGASIDVLSGKNAKESQGRLVWTNGNIWRNDGDPGILYDAAGGQVSIYE